MIAANQGRVFAQLLAELQPHFRTDRNLPSRIQQRLAKEKRFGARDRRLYRELLYTAVRFLPWLEEQPAPDRVLETVVWLAADTPGTRPLKAACSAGKTAPFPVAEKAAALGAKTSLLPEWFRAHCPAAFEPPELDVLHARPSLWIRLQTDDLRAVTDEFDARGWTYRSTLNSEPIPRPAPPFRPSPLPSAIEMLSEADVTTSSAYLDGRIEVQDLGSQLLLEAVQPAAPGRWLDTCAGAGGKTLQLARLLGPRGRVDAADPRPAALEELKLRARRANLQNIAVLHSLPSQPGGYDGVLVDAPCSGSGTWRRAPHLKWCTDETAVAAAAKTQLAILARAAPHVRPGGLLVYATCSLSCRENTDVVHAFLAQHREFAPVGPARDFGARADDVGGLAFLPSLHNTDGFYVAVLSRN